MPSVTVTTAINADSWYFENSGDWYGNGSGPRLYVGRTTLTPLVGPSRFAIRIPRGTLFAGAPTVDAVTAFNIKMRVKPGCDDTGGTVRMFLERATTPMGENGYSVDCGLNQGGAGGDPGTVRWPGPTRVTADRATYSGAPADNAWITINALALGKYWYAHPELTELVLVGIAANATLDGYDETTASRRMTLYSRHTSSAPYAELIYNDNLAPYAPSDLAPVAGARSSSTAGTTATVSGRHVDPEGDSATKYQAQAFPAGTTDAQADSGAVLPVKNDTITSTTAHLGIRSHTFTGLAGRTTYRWRLHFYDGQWGPYSPLQDIATAYEPSVVNMSVEPGTLTPKLYASILSSDPGDYITAIEETILQDVAAGSVITKWASGKQAIGGSPSTSEVLYGGTTLGYGAPPGPYRRNTILYNRDDVPSDLSPTQFFTLLQAVGPNVSPGDTLTKINTQTPTVTLTDPGAANIDRARVEWLNEAGDTVLNDTGEIVFASAPSRAVTAPAGIYGWGVKPKLRAYIRVTGNANLGPARTVQIRLNAAPGSPYPVTVAGGQTVQREDLVWVTTDTTPDITLPFRDTDKDEGLVEAAVRREVELRTMADAHVASSPYIITSGITNVFTAPTLTIETQYKVRGRYDDNANVRSDWSEYALVKISAAPTLSSVLPANAATITDPSPDVSWVYASSGGKPQARALLVLSAGSTELYNSGWVEGTALLHHVPAFILPNSTVISWVLTVEDSDGLQVSISRTFTTAFTTPAALASLTITPDLDEMALLCIWPESALTVGEFEAYIVEARTEGGQFRQVAYITEKGTTALLYKGAAHNRETIIRVTQTNGWAPSDPVEGSGLLVDELRQHWIRTASEIEPLQYVTAHSGDTVTDTEELSPLGRGEKLLLTWQTTGFEGQLSIMSPSREQVERLRGFKAAGTIVMLKFPYGAVRYARITDTPGSDAVEDWSTANIKYIEIAAESANF
jgi:hypothetical protein